MLKLLEKHLNEKFTEEIINEMDTTIHYSDDLIKIKKTFPLGTLISPLGKKNLIFK
tara:strand:+ start:910 stop:1077 length:168 start_codon:yes stop_codon:yes gene_type:complete